MGWVFGPAQGSWVWSLVVVRIIKLKYCNTHRNMQIQYNILGFLLFFYLTFLENYLSNVDIKTWKFYTRNIDFFIEHIIL